MNDLMLELRYRMKRVELHIRGRKRGEHAASAYMRRHYEDCLVCGGNGFLLTFMDASYIEVPCPTCTEEG